MKNLLNKTLDILPWNLVVAISVIIGIGLTFWASQSMLDSSRDIWKKHLEYTATQRIRPLTSEWDRFEESMQTLADFYAQPTEELTSQKFSTLTQNVMSKHGYIKNIFFVPAKDSLISQTFKTHSTLTNFNYDDAKLSAALKKDSSVPNLPTILSTPAIAVMNKDSDNKLIVKTQIPSKGHLITEFDVNAFLYSINEGNGADENSNMALTATIGTGTTPLFQKTLLPEITPNKVGHEHTDRYTWGTQLWKFNWTYTKKAQGGASYAAGLTLFLLGGLMTLAFGWLVYRQSGLSEQVRKEVVERTNELERMSRRFRLITDNSFDLITIIKPEGYIEYTNGAFHKTLGYSRAELKDKDISQYIHQSDREIFRNILESAIHNIQDENIINCRFQHRKGNWVHIEMGIRSLYDTELSNNNVVLHCRDVTKSKEFAEQLATSEQRFKDFAESSSDWLWEVNNDFEFTYVSPGIHQTLGYSPDEMIGRVKFDILFSGGEDEKNTRELIESRVERQQKYRDVEFWTRSKTGERVCLSMSGIPIFNEKKEFTGFRGAAANITTSKIDRENMYKLATTDHLTGLLNRARFSEELERALSLSKRHKTQGVLLFVDLDQFKSINDTYGHDAGDELIRAVSDILQKEVRTTDTVARLGGDEFGIIMHNIDPKLARTKVQKVIDELNALRVNYNNITLHVTMSVGMIPYPQEDKDSASLLMRADLAMYRAKDMGRNRLFFDGDLTDEEEAHPSTKDDSGVIQERKESLREQMKWVERLRGALETGDFEIHYQPLVPQTKQPRPYFEALIRLRDEQGQLGAPGIFIDAAEHFGLIQQLDIAVANRAISQQIELKKKGCEVDVSINLSGKSLGDHDVMRRLKEIVERYKEDINPSNFTFEITETAILHDPKAGKDINTIQNFMKELSDIGFKFALDDFGTGFSSFNYLKHLSVDVLKVDGSFILPLENSDKDKLFVKAIADLAKSLGIRTVAEFVENEEILGIVDELGIDLAQGYHLSKPKGDLEKLYNDFSQKCMADFEDKKKSKKSPKKKSA